MAKKKNRKTSKRAVEEALKAQKKSTRKSKRSNTEQVSESQVKQNTEVSKKSSKGFEELPLKDIKKDLIKTLGYAVFSFGVVFALYATSTGIDEISFAAAAVQGYISGLVG